MMRRMLVMVLISGCGVPLELSESSIDFGFLDDCQVHTRELTLRNVGDRPLTVNVSRVDEFIVEPTDNVTLQAGESLPVKLTFDANLDSRSQQRVLKIRHEGKVIEEVPVFASVGGRDFGAVLRDFGTVAVDDTSELLGPQLQVSQTVEPLPDGFTLLRDSTSTWKLVFTPAEPRAHNGRLLITNPGRCPNAFLLSGVGVPALVASPVQVKLTSNVGTPTQAFVTLTNNSLRELHVTGLAVNDAEFTVNSDLIIARGRRDSSGALLPGTARIAVSWTPTKAGTKRAELSMRIDRPTQPEVTVPISATAQ